MPVYQYIGFDFSGKKVKGIIEADTETKAREKLLNSKIFITKIEAIQKKTRDLSLFGQLSIFARRRSSEEKIGVFTRQLATLLSSGIPLADAIDVLIKQMNSIGMEKSIRAVCEEIKNGKSFSEALSGHEEFFSPLYVNMVKAGESSGNLENVLKRLAEYIHMKYTITSKIKAAMIYPVFIMIVAIIVVFLTIVVLVPKITIILTDLGKSLPLPTLIVIKLSKFFSHYWIFIIIGMIMCGYIINRIQLTEKGKMFFDKYRFKLPVIGPLLKKHLISNFCLTFATLLKSGIPAVESLQIVSKAINNSYVGKIIVDAVEKIKRGQSIASSFQDGFFPPIIPFMIEIGEKSGTLDEILEQLGEDIIQEVQIDAQKLVSLVEPFVILLMAGVVIFIVLSILLPILQMTGGVNI